MLRVRLPLFALLLIVTGTLAGQSLPPGAEKRVPFEPGYAVYLLVDMEGMGSAVNVGEVIAGTEGPAYKDRGGRDWWDFYRGLLTEEVNATIAGARAAGAERFVVNEGHGANRFATVEPWSLDPEAVLIRGYPKPMVMSTGIDSTFRTAMFLAMHASPARPGVMAHNYAFADFRVNGRALNETGINALVLGEHGVAVSLVSGDDELEHEVRELLGDRVVYVTTKIALRSNSAITFSPAKVQAMLAEGAREAVLRAKAGELRPFKLAKPYTIDFTLRPSYPASVVEGVDKITAYQLEKTGERSYRFVTSSAAQMAYLLDAIESIVLP
jgi:D-amino peptidase